MALAHIEYLKLPALASPNLNKEREDAAHALLDSPAVPAKKSRRRSTKSWAS